MSAVIVRVEARLIEHKQSLMLDTLPLALFGCEYFGYIDRRVTLEGPESEPVEGSCVGGRLHISDDEPRHQSLRLGRKHAGAQARALRGRVQGQDHPPPPLTASQDERRLSRRRGAAQCPSCTDPLP